MSRAPSQMRGLAARLIAVETKGGRASADHPPATAQVFEKLRPHLATLMGKAGFRAVLSRALVVVGAEVPWLASVEVDAEGMLVGWGAAEVPGAAEEWAEAGVLLVAQVLALLVAFIGENLTLRLVRDVWPKLSVEDLQSSTGDHP